MKRIIQTELQRDSDSLGHGNQGRLFPLFKSLAESLIERICCGKRRHLLVKPRYDISQNVASGMWFSRARALFEQTIQCTLINTELYETLCVTQNVLRGL